MFDVSATTSTSAAPLLSETIASYFLLVTVVLLVTRVWLTQATQRRVKSSKNDAKPLPGPWGIPVLGNMLSIGQKAPHISLMKMAEKFGNIFQIRLGSRPVLVLNGYEAIRKALVKQPTVFAGRPDLLTFDMIRSRYSPGCGSLSFSTYSENWKLHRKLAESSLRHFTACGQVKFVERVVSTEAGELAKHISDAVNNNSGDGSTDKAQNMRLAIRLAVGNIICWFMFNKRQSYDDKVLLKLLDISNRFTEATGSGNPVDFLPWMKVFVTKSTNNFQELLKEFNGFVRNMITKHHEQYEDGSERDIIDHLVSSGRRHDKSEMTRVGLTEEQLLETALDYYGAGFETVSTTLEWTFLYMAAHPEIQAEVHREIDAVVGQNRTPTLDDRAKLPFTQACITEVMRHATVVPFSIPHSTTEDTVLDGFYVPKDTVVFVNLHSAHHDETIWSEPEIFKPRRFITADGGLDLDKKNRVIPFSVGRRRCIGSDLARLELFLFFSIFMQKFSVESTRPEGVTMESVYGLARRAKHLDVKLVPRS
ncbi:cytochrome P450 1A1-like [Diadema antillarum]|uniref:cytochrome P450 1A1-like n=1 Tax=Diadema antillarum TaxID=105358 RepID=UPI003A89C376